jgi:hypothetical protein
MFDNLVQILWSPDDKKNGDSPSLLSER